MIILHGGFLGSHLHVWGEASPVPGGGEPAAGRARRGKASAAAAGGRRRADSQDQLPNQSFQHDAGALRLTDELRALDAGLAPGPRAIERVIVWLPTVGGDAVPSSQLLAGPAGEPSSPAATKRTKTALVPWAIDSVRLDVDQAITLLCRSIDQPLLAPGVVVGKDLAFWAAAVRFAGALAARGHVLPGMVPSGKGYRACWEPAFAGEDSIRLARLAAAMPAACRALAHNGDAPPEQPAQSVLQEFLTGVVDHTVRFSTGTQVPAPAAHRGRRNGSAESPRVAARRKSTFDSVHEAWLYALRSPDAMISADQRQVAELSEQLRQWRQPLAARAATPFRLCFRLEEPPQPDEADGNGRSRRKVQPGGNGWFVRYLLQAADDPSLLVEATDAWKPTRRNAAILNRRGFSAGEYLLSSLGAATSLCPRLESSLKTAAPPGCPLDGSGAHEFLNEKAWLLEEAGFGVLLPAWWSRKGTKLRLSLRAAVTGSRAARLTGSGLSLDHVIHFNWQVALGDQVLSYQELEALARLKSPLVRLRGQWVQLNAEEIRSALEFWKKKQPAPGKATVREILRMSLGGVSEVKGLAFEGVSAGGWVGDLLAQLDQPARLEELPAPNGFQGELRPYQRRGYSWLAFLRRWGLGACLADDMGLGKTIQTLALIERDWEVNGRRPVLLVCPMSVVGNWQKEAARFTPRLPVVIHHGSDRAKGAAFARRIKGQAIVLSSFALLHRDLELFKPISWAGVVLDEAQNIKNPQTRQAQAARALTADYRVALTGTPVENHVGDLWSVMEFLNPGFLGSQAEFKRRFFVPIQFNRDPEAAERLKRLTRPFVLRRLKTDRTIISDLPEKLEMKVFCTLTKEQASLYAAVVREAEEALGASEGIQRKGLILATLSKLKQVCNHPAQFLGDNSALPGRSGKLARLAEMLEEVLEIGERALVFSQFSEMGELLRRHLQEAFAEEVLFLHGGLSKGRRESLLERFEAADGPRVFVLSLKAGGLGLNLTRANHVFHFDRWWNPAVENQATDRAFRIGQTKNVQVHKFLCVGTLEERIDEMIEQKQAVAGSVIGAGEGWLTELSNAELKELFSLRREAIGE